MKRIKTWFLTSALLLAGTAAWGQVYVTDVCTPPEPGCYCNDGPSGNVECRKYGLENEGFYIRAWAGWSAVPKIRVNMTHISNTAPNVGFPECWDIRNNSGTEYFVPTSTRDEWNSFKLAALGGSFPGVTMEQCPVCGDSVCTNTATYWGFVESCGSDDSMNPAPQTGDPMCNQDCGACPIVCGDGFCAAGAEHCMGGAGAGYNPCVECGTCSCGDAYFDCTGQCGTCPSCSPCCGDGTCDSGSGEDGTNCAADCAAPVCGDTICNGAEDPCSCPGDCTTDTCGDGCCGVTESCGDNDTAPACNSDCGACSCTGAVPVNATLCTGDDSGLTADTPNTSVLNCTAGTKCEYVCDDFTDLIGGECRYCWDPTLNACYDIQPACAGYADCPADLMDGCTTVGANCRYNYTGDCSIDPCGDEYTCGSCTFTCQGSAPADSVLCPGDNTGLPRPDISTSLVASCTAGTKCEYECAPGFYYDAGVCTAYVCTGTVPTNSTLCAGDDTGLLADTPRTAVNSCTVPDKCEYQCDPGYQAVGNSCVPFVCTGPIAAFTQLCCVDYDMDMICDPDDEGLLADTPRTLVDACTQPVKCEYTCRPNYTRVGASCTPDYFCLDPQPSNATLCPDGSGFDDWDLTADTPKTAVETGACTVGTKCEYECLAGYIVDGNNCRLPDCTGSIDSNATLCPGDDSGLAVDTPYTTVAACTAGTYCETTCDDGYQVDGANSCRANVCTGGVPGNAEYCPGDDSNIPGNADVAVTLVAACTGGTKCETICSAGFELDVPGTSCVVEVFDCLGTPDPNATLCPGDDAGLPVDTPVTTVAACGADYCEYTCNDGYHDAGVNQCDINVCQGAAPANADLCPGDDTGITGNADVTRTLVTSCTAPTFCEYTCADGFYYDTGACVPNMCTGAVPANSSLCAGDDTGIPGNGDVGRTLVPACTAGTWCEYSCTDGYNYDTGVCDLNQCTGTVPSNSTLCAGDDTGITGNSDVVRTAVSVCTAGVFCEYQCDDGFHESGGTCDPNVCIGAAPANATLCAGDDTSIPGNANVTRTAAAACTAGTWCEYTCDPLFVLDGGICRPYMCTGVMDPNSTVCPGDDTGLTADTPRTTVSACTGGTDCEYTCDSGYHDAGANQCDANVCTGAPPLNAAICPGDDSNIPGNGDLALSLVPACTAGTWCEYACDSGFHLEMGACAVNICTGTVPINATVCAGDEANISGNSNVARTVVGSCTVGTKCEYTCDDGFNYNGSDCESLNSCIGPVPSDSILCPGDDANIGGNSDVTRTVVPACTAGTKCEYTCVDTHHEDAGACVANVCLPPTYANASYCTDDDIDVPGGTDMVSQLVITCTATKCEYECDSGYSVNNGICEPDGEWIRVGLYLGQPAFSPACGDPFSGYPGYTLDRSDPCPAAFLGDVYDCFDETLPGIGNRVELQCHQKL